MTPGIPVSTLTTRFLYNEQENSFDRINRIYKIYNKPILLIL